MVWFPRGYRLDDHTVIRKYLASGKNWQLYDTNLDGYALAVTEELPGKWEASNLLPSAVFQQYEAGDIVYHVLVSESEYLLSSLENGPFPSTFAQAKSFAIALKRTRDIPGTVSVGDGIFIEKYSSVLPTYTGCTDDDALTLGRFLAGGVGISVKDYDKLCRFVSWMRPEAIADIINTAGIEVSDKSSLMNGNEKQGGEQTGSARRYVPHKSDDHFELPGRPELEAFFNEHVVDIVLNAEKYKRMGIGFPAAIVLHGPPGCGKTFAVDRLSEFFGWPTYHIDSGTIGSPYIHDTSKKIAEVFETAINNSPSMLIIDEMEAFLTDRGSAQLSGQHHLEEVAEFLRRIPEATSKNVLIIAMTNMIDSIDPAIIRRGRFDHIIEVKMPTKKEVASLLHKQLKDLPISDDVDIDFIARQLQGRALSDVTFVIREAGRAAVKHDKSVIDQELFLEACDSLPKAKKEEKRKIGF